MNGLDGLLGVQNDFIVDMVNALFGEEESHEVQAPMVAQPHVESNRPIVQGDKTWVTWYKMLSLYMVWGWISWNCSLSAIFFLMVNDGGVFYNECYYMFYNGVVWYNPPEPFVPKAQKVKDDTTDEEGGGGLFGGGGNADA